MCIGYISLLAHWQISESLTLARSTRPPASSVDSQPTASPASESSPSSPKAAGTDSVDANNNTPALSDAEPNAPAAPAPHTEPIALPSHVRRLVLQVGLSALLLLLLLLLFHHSVLRFVSAPVARSIISALVLLMFGAHLVLALAFKWRQLRARLAADRSSASAASANCSARDYTEARTTRRGGALARRLHRPLIARSAARCASRQLSA